jgi:hypothetical protein
MQPNGPRQYGGLSVKSRSRLLGIGIAKSQTAAMGCFPTTAPGIPSTRDGTLARSPERSEGSRCKEGMARVFAVMVQILLSITPVAVQV